MDKNKNKITTYFLNIYYRFCEGIKHVCNLMTEVKTYLGGITFWSTRKSPLKAFIKFASSPAGLSEALSSYIWNINSAVSEDLNVPYQAITIAAKIFVRQINENNFHCRLVRFLTICLIIISIFFFQTELPTEGRNDGLTEGEPLEGTDTSSRRHLYQNWASAWQNLTSKDADQSIHSPSMARVLIHYSLVAEML